MPKRFQQKRIKGWRKPANSIPVGRQTKWGNPFPITDTLSQEESIAKFEQYLAKMPAHERKEFLAPLRGKNLLCWCPEHLPCHADVLLKWANR